MVCFERQYFISLIQHVLTTYYLCNSQAIKQKIKIVVSDDVDDIITKATIITLHIISVTLKSTLVKARHRSSSYTVDSFSVIFHNRLVGIFAEEWQSKSGTSLQLACDGVPCAEVGLSYNKFQFRIHTFHLNFLTIFSTMHPKFQNSKDTPTLVDYLDIYLRRIRNHCHHHHHRHRSTVGSREPDKQFWLFRGLLGLYHVFRRSRRSTIYGHCQVQQGNYTENCGQH